MYTLILFFHVGMFGNTDSNAATHIPDFHSKVLCEQAGKASEALVANTKKELRFVCVNTTGL